jgi:hypothetical protein
MVMQFYRAKDTRERGVKLDGSPNFLHTYGEILTTAMEYVDIEQDIRAATKYLPLESLVLTNHSSEDVMLEINGVDYAVVPAGVITTVTQAIRYFRLTNLTAGTVAAGDCRANLKTAPLGANEAARDAFQVSSR